MGSSLSFTSYVTMRIQVLMITLFLLLNFSVLIAQSNQEVSKFWTAGLHAVNVIDYSKDIPLVSFHVGFASKKFIKNNYDPKAYSITQFYFHYDNILVAKPYRYSNQKDNIIFSLVGFNFDYSIPLGNLSYKDNLKHFLVFGTSITPIFWARNSINNKISYSLLEINPLNFYLGFSADYKINDSFFLNISYNHYVLEYFPSLIDKEKPWYYTLFDRTLNSIKITGHFKWKN